MTDPSHQIVFYDIDAVPRRTFAPNPWKARFALNFKNVPYRTEWVDHTQIETVRKSLGLAPCRFDASGRPVYTLPIIHDPKTNVGSGESFDIAAYLDEHYPSSTPLIPPGAKGLVAAFNAYVDSIFGGPGGGRIMLHLHGMPFNPDTAERSRKIFSDRAGKPWDEIGAQGQRRVELLKILESSLRPLVRMYEREGGPWFMGENISYADFIIGGWVKFSKETLQEGEFEQLCTWHDGFFGNLYARLGMYAVMK